MSKLLPIPTQVVDEAKIYALQYLEEARSMHLFGSPLPVMDPGAGSWKAQNFYKVLALSGVPQQLQWVLDNAREGEANADRALRDVYAALRHHGRHVPPTLHAYIDEGVLRGPVGPGRGKSRARNAFADVVLASLVFNLQQKFGLPPTRRPTSKNQSACDIVATVVSENSWGGRLLDYRQIQSIWNKHKSRFERVPMLQV
jgi:hypothetical protein